MELRATYYEKQIVYFGVLLLNHKKTPGIKLEMRELIFLKFKSINQVIDPDRLSKGRLFIASILLLFSKFVN